MSALARVFVACVGILVAAAGAGPAASASAEDPKSGACFGGLVDKTDASGKLTGSECSDVIVASEETTSIEGGSGDDVIIGAPNVVLITGGDGWDYIVGNGGGPVLMGGAGDDFISGGAAESSGELGDGAANLVEFAAARLTGEEEAEFESLVVEQLGLAEEAVVEDADSSSSEVREGAIANSPLIQEIINPIGEAEGSDVSIREIRSLREEAEAYAGMTKDFSKKLSQISGAQRAFDGLGDDLEGNGEDNFIFGGRGGDTIDGKGGNDMLYGGTDDDVIDGGPGHDYLLGGMGTDTMNGEVGNDILQGDATGDKMQDDGGPTDTDDVLSFASGGSPGFDKNMSAYPNFPSTPNQRGVYVDLSVKIANNGSVTDGGGTDKANDDPAQGTRFQDFEHVVGTPFADHIVGSTGVNVLQGGGGSDVIEGNGGGDVLFGDMGGDNLTATAGSWILGGVGEDYCAGTTVLVDCEPKPFNWVSQRDEGAISVGMTTQAWAGNVRSQLYLAGSTANWVTENGEDDVTVTQIPGSGSTPPTFTFSSSAATTQGQFSLDPEDQSPGCSYTATLVTCAPASNVTTLVLAGFGSNDRIDLSNVARMTSTIILGGDGHDDLWGGNYTEDFIVDGDGNDSLFGKAADDGLVNTGGTDDLWAAENDDLLLSNEVCTGDTLGGGAGIDSSSWAKFESESAIPAGSVHGVFASIFTGNIGKNVGAELSCSGAGPVGTFAGMEDLEGSKHWDVLRGDGGENQVLGRGTADQLRSYQGDDLIIANAGDLDNIDCGNQQDFSVIDFTQYGDERDNSCEGFDRRAPRFDQD